MWNRREWLGSVLASGALLAGGRLLAKPRPEVTGRILVAGCWHDINIGDIAHAPGLLQLLQQGLPNVDLTLWPYPTLKGPHTQRELTPEVRGMLTTAFPDLTILKPGGMGQSQGATRPDLAEAIDKADLFVLGSGGYHGSPVNIWRATTDKPFGIYGVTFGRVPVQAVNGAAFIYCRDAHSVKNVREAGVDSPVIEFGPDSTFGMQLRDEPRAEDFLRKHQLQDQQFLCVIPRLRYSPYHEIYDYEPTASDLEQARISDQHKQADHQVLRELMVHWVRTTGQKVLACPEMTYGVPLAKEQLVDPLPPEIRRQVVWKDSFWLCDEAASVFARARAVVSLDCHAPIIALTTGTPAIHLRLPTDNPLKSQMFAEIGLPEWIREHSETSGEQLIALVDEIHQQPELAQEKVDQAMAFVRVRQEATLNTIQQILTRN